VLAPTGRGRGRERCLRLQGRPDASTRGPFGAGLGTQRGQRAGPSICRSKHRSRLQPRCRPRAWGYRSRALLAPARSPGRLDPRAFWRRPRYSAGPARRAVDLWERAPLATATSMPTARMGLPVASVARSHRPRPRSRALLAPAGSPGRPDPRTFWRRPRHSAGPARRAVDLWERAPLATATSKPAARMGLPVASGARSHRPRPLERTRPGPITLVKRAT